jgi:hypothetical protein
MTVLNKFRRSLMGMALVGSFLYPVGLHLEPAPLKAVVMVDTSSSFRYLQEALERLKRLAIWLLPGDGVALVAFDRDPRQFFSGPLDNPEVLVQVLGSIGYSAAVRMTDYGRAYAFTARAAGQGNCLGGRMLILGDLQEDVRTVAPGRVPREMEIVCLYTSPRTVGTFRRELEEAAGALSILNARASGQYLAELESQLARRHLRRQVASTLRDLGAVSLALLLPSLACLLPGLARRNVLRLVEGRGPALEVELSKLAVRIFRVGSWTGCEVPVLREDVPAGAGEILYWLGTLYYRSHTGRFGLENRIYQGRGWVRLPASGCLEVAPGVTLTFSLERRAASEGRAGTYDSRLSLGA